MTLLSDNSTRGARVWRAPIKDWQAAESRNVDDSTLAEAINTLLRVDDLNGLKTRMIERYATILDEQSNDDVGTTTQTLSPATRLDYAMGSAIMMGQYELMRSYLFDSVVRQSATLFPPSSYQYDSDIVEKIITEERAAGGAGIAAQRWDAYSVACGASLLHLTVRRGVLMESEVPVTSFHWAEPEWIEVEGEGRMTPSSSELDDCAAVGMCLGSAGTAGYRWATWIGPTHDLPLGRHCEYTARQWYEIPDVGTTGCYDFIWSGNGDMGSMVHGPEIVAGAQQVANPLSLWAERQKRWDLPTYPFARLLYDPLSAGLLPTTTSLYSVCAELDIASGIVLGAALKGARGQRVLTREQGGPIPATMDEGTTVLTRGQTLTVTGWGPEHASAALDVATRIAAQIAEAHRVPGFLALSGQSQTAVPSGYALKIMTHPLQEFRRIRGYLNASNVRRRFDVERALINSYLAREAIPMDAVETWDVGEREFPADDTTTIDNWIKRIDKGEADIADMAMELRGIETRDAAIKLLEEHKAQRDEHSELFAVSAAPQQQQQPMGGAGGFAAFVRGARRPAGAPAPGAE